MVTENEAKDTDKWALRLGSPQRFMWRKLCPCMVI